MNRFIFLNALGTLLVIVPAWRILGRAGFSPYFSFLLFIPIVGYVAIFAMLAFGRWPMLEAAQPARYCSQCGSQVAEGAAFCVKCGTPVGVGLRQAPVEDIGQSAAMRMLLPVGRSGYAIAAGYLGLFALLLVPAPLAVLFGILAINDIKKNPSKHGMGRAIFGIVMGVLGTLALAWALAAMVLYRGA